MFKRTVAAVMILAAILCLTVKVDAAKSDNWLIYWYVCGTDIETNHISFKAGTNLLSDNPNDLILADPENNAGCSTRSIHEVEKATLSPNVKIFMQAGGAYVWGHEKFRALNAKIDTKLLGSNLPEGDTSDWSLSGDISNGVVSNGKIGRYLYDNEHRDWTPREQLPISGEGKTETDMGSQAGLVSFLKAGQQLERELYPDGNVRRVFIFVDHGITYEGGIYGVCNDSYTGNSLSLKEIHDAFDEVKSGWTNLKGKPFDVVAFDACNMSDYETAVAVENAADYMVASQEETNIYVGLGYTGLLNALSKNPAMNGKDLGKVICETYWDNSIITDAEFNRDANTILTSSLVDLSAKKMNALKTAYANFGKASLDVARQHQRPDEFVHIVTKFRRAANGAEKYPSEAAATHFKYSFPPKLVDLKGFAENARDNFPELKKAGSDVITAVNNVVLYQKRGESLNRGGGLSIYYPFDLIRDGNNIELYQQVTAESGLAPETQGKFYEFIYNEVDSNLQTVEETNPETGETVLQKYIAPGSLFDLSNLKDTPVAVDAKTKTVSIALDENSRKGVESVRCQLIYVKAVTGDNGTENLQGLFLGGDNDMKDNWTNGTFKSTFSGKWVMFEGQPVFVQLISDGTRKDKNGKKIGGTELCSIPLQINGQVRNLFVSCKYPEEKFTIIGMPSETDNSGMPTGEIDSLKIGDVVNPVYLNFDISEEESEHFEEAAHAKYTKELDFSIGPEITLGTDKPIVEVVYLPDGYYFYIFEFVNPVGGDNEYTKQGAVFTVQDGKIIAVRHDDDIEDLSDLKE